MCTVPILRPEDLHVISLTLLSHMAKKLFVGNISWDAKDDDLKNLFSEHGEIEEAIIIKDKFSGRSKGFGFVTFTNDEDADKAVEALNEQDFMGRNIVVNEARPPKHEMA